MNNKKTYFLSVVMLFLSANVMGCLKITDLTKKQNKPLQLSFTERQAKYEQDAETVKKTLHERFNARVITGFTPAGTRFLHSVYTAKTGADFYTALMAKGDFFIPLYIQERVEECSAIGIVILAESLSFIEKKKIIHNMIHGVDIDEPDHVAKYAFTATEQDKEFAFFEKFKICAPLIIQKMGKTTDDMAKILKSVEFWHLFEAQDSLL